MRKGADAVKEKSSQTRLRKLNHGQSRRRLFERRQLPGAQPLGLRSYVVGSGVSRYPTTGYLKNINETTKQVCVAVLHASDEKTESAQLV